MPTKQTSQSKVREVHSAIRHESQEDVQAGELLVQAGFHLSISGKKTSSNRGSVRGYPISCCRSGSSPFRRGGFASCRGVSGSTNSTHARGEKAGTKHTHRRRPQQPRKGKEARTSSPAVRLRQPTKCFCTDKDRRPSKTQPPGGERACVLGDREREKNLSVRCPYSERERRNAWGRREPPRLELPTMSFRELRSEL